MRSAFINELCMIAKDRHDIVLLCGDLGFSVLEPFANAFPARYFNVGIAEQNMIGVAAGLARAGKTVIVYSIANFGIVRCLEQIRNDICYHNVSVIVVTVGSGVSYGSQGYTHHGIEDMSFTRVLPNMAVASPADGAETRWALRRILERGGPASLRLGRGGEEQVHDVELSLDLGQSIQVMSGGKDVTFISTGVILPEVIEAAKILKKRNIDAGVLSVPFVEPLDEQAITKAMLRSRLLVTVEEHINRGGLGGAVAEIVSSSSSPKRPKLLRAGISGAPLKVAYNQAAIRALNGIDRSGLLEKVLNEL